MTARSKQMASNNPRNIIQCARVEHGELIIDWGDDHRSRFHPVWLRHQCECADCGSSVNAVRRIRIHHIPGDIVPSILATTDTELQLGWSNDDHQSTYEAGWLRDHCLSGQERDLRRHRPTLWDGSIASHLPRASLEQAESSAPARLHMLQAVADFGFCKISHVPIEEDQAQRLISLVGKQRQTHYGSYDLSKKPTVDNVGDVTSALDPHTDETYRLSAIGITVFQVHQPSSNGGDSTLVDGFEAVRRLREQAPQDFELLSRVPVTTHRIDAAQNSGGQSRWYVAHLPVIRLNPDSSVAGVRLNERQISTFDVDADLVGPCYSALRRPFNILYDPELRLTFKLRAGEGLLFDNQRVLHGRTAFEPEQPPRSVLTSSVDLDDFYSTLRNLRSVIGEDTTPMVYSQGMAS